MQKEGWRKQVENILKKRELVEAVRGMAKNNPNLTEQQRNHLMSEEVVGDFWEYAMNYKWTVENLEEIKREFPGQTIFVRDRQVVFKSRDAVKTALRLCTLGPKHDQYYIYDVPEPARLRSSFRN